MYTYNITRYGFFTQLKTKAKTTYTQINYTHTHTHTHIYIYISTYIHTMLTVAPVERKK